MGKTDLTKNELERMVVQLQMEHDRLVLMISCLVYAAGGQVRLKAKDVKTVMLADPKERTVKMRKGLDDSLVLENGGLKKGLIERIDGANLADSNLGAREEGGPDVEDSVGSGDPQGGSGEEHQGEGGSDRGAGVEL